MSAAIQTIMLMCRHIITTIWRMPPNSTLCSVTVLQLVQPSSLQIKPLISDHLGKVENVMVKMLEDGTAWERETQLRDAIFKAVVDAGKP